MIKIPRKKSLAHLVTLLATNILLISIVSISTNVHGDINKVVIPDNVISIQRALEIISSGGEVIVKNGIFSEHIYVRKSIKLFGLKDVKLYGPIKVLSTTNVSITGFTIDIIPPGTEVGITIFNSSKIIIENITFIGAGIIIYDSDHIVIRNCRFIDIVGPAIRILGSSKYIIIEFNNINNTYMGLFVEEGETIVFRYNTVSTKDLAVLLHKKAKNVTIYMNNFINIKVEDYGTNNIWYESKLKLGNFWKDLEGYDINSDGIVDIPMYIDNKILDLYPLVTYFYEYLNTTNNIENNLKNSQIRSLYDVNPYILLVIIIVIITVGIIITISRRRY